ncbi:hypothetical protein GCM10023321_60100 [Pseudonocardia eucalypti]|uniref:Uncharacterized protein n=1 Tax=Pseudonocardia eucalypti TaxID=648755 RepID=A0ABP9QU09_9PSEU|nr:outer membrane biosynthesis protein TonB [Pseudonocardia eucalypti]
MSRFLTHPTARLILGVLAGGVLLANAIVLIGLLGKATESAVPRVVPPVLSPPPATDVSPTPPPPAPAPVSPTPRPVPETPAAKPHPKPAEPHRTTTKRQRPTKSPFEDRCRSGEIPAWLCREIPD